KALLVPTQFRRQIGHLFLQRNDVLMQFLGRGVKTWFHTLRVRDPGCVSSRLPALCPAFFFKSPSEPELEDAPGVAPVPDRRAAIAVAADSPAAPRCLRSEEHTSELQSRE